MIVRVSTGQVECLGFALASGHSLLEFEGKKRIRKKQLLLIRMEYVFVLTV